MEIASAHGDAAPMEIRSTRSALSRPRALMRDKLSLAPARQAPAALVDLSASSTAR